MNICCASRFFASRPDFKSQKSALREVVEGAGHIFEMYPKFCCETNWIEMYWGATKREARLNCDCTFKSLEKNINTYLDNAANPRMIRKYFHHCFKYIEAYSKCDDGRDVAMDLKKFVDKRYASHTKVYDIIE